MLGLHSKKSSTYATYVSGFSLGGPAQSIQLQPKQEDSILQKDPEISTAFRAHLHDDYGVELLIHAREIRFLTSRPLSLDQLTTIWNEIAETLPDRQLPLPKHTVFNPERFSRKN